MQLGRCNYSRSHIVIRLQPSKLNTSCFGLLTSPTIVEYLLTIVHRRIAGRTFCPMLVSTPRY